jgi:uncharacterized protein (DUF885 family)/MFS family permease
VRYLLLGALINQLGLFIQIYLVVFMLSRGFGVIEAGGALAVLSTGAIIGTVLAASLAERVGHRNLIVLSTLAFAAAVAATPSLVRPDLPTAAWIGIIFVAGVFSQMYRTPAASILSEHIPEDTHVMGFSLFRIAINVGGALGPLIATALASVDWSYVFWFNALCSLAYAAIAAARLPDDGRRPTARRTRAEQTGEAASWGAILADGRFLAFLAAMLISVMVYAQLYATVPIAIEARGLPLTTYSTVLVVYSLVLICLELKVSPITRRYAPWIPGTLGTLILCAAIASFGLTLTSPVALVLSALALVCGLMISGPTMFAYPARFPLAIRGRAISLTQVASPSGTLSDRSSASPSSIAGAPSSGACASSPGSSPPASPPSACARARRRGRKRPCRRPRSRGFDGDLIVPPRFAAASHSPRGRPRSPPAAPLERCDVTLDIRDIGEALLDLRRRHDPLDDAFRPLGPPRHALPDLSDASLAGMRAEFDGLSAPSAGDVGTVDGGVVALQARELSDRLDMRLWATFMSGYDHSLLGRVTGALPDLPATTDSERRAHLALVSSIAPHLDSAVAPTAAAARSGRAPLASSLADALRRWRALLEGKGAALAPDAAGPEARAALAEAFEASVAPAVARYAAALSEAVAPLARDDARPGLVHVAGGEGDYDRLVTGHTDGFGSPGRIHALGHAEVARIHDALRRLADDADATVADLLRPPADEAAYGSRADVLAHMTAVLEAAPRDFAGTVDLSALPPVAIKDVPAHLAASSPTAYYLPADGAGRPGTIVLNPSRLVGQPVGTALAMIYHEGSPGHHAQFEIARAADLPGFRRTAWFNAFIEGWGLYCEELAEERGLYRGRAARIGKLALELLRAARLVVDTALHHLGWPAVQAERYLVEQAGLAPEAAASEVRRYIEYPAQALSYAVGKIGILELRAGERKRLGPAFDPAPSTPRSSATAPRPSRSSRRRCAPRGPRRRRPDPHDKDQATCTPSTLRPRFTNASCAGSPPPASPRSPSTTSRRATPPARAACAATRSPPPPRASSRA